MNGPLEAKVTLVTGCTGGDRVVLWQALAEAGAKFDGSELADDGSDCGYAVR